MKIQTLFHKIKIGFARRNEPSIPYTTEAKRYGDCGEDTFFYEVQARLPDCKIKKNIIIQTSEGNAEIDFLVLYKNKIFAIEIKHWKGHLVERGGEFVQHKRDRWTDEIYTKTHRSPFKQLARAVYLLRKQIPNNAWLNAVVFFDGSDYIEAARDNVWFDTVDKLVSHIVTEGKASWGNSANDFFERCTAADHLYCSAWDKSLHCIICDDSLIFNTVYGILDRSNIRSISIFHHWSYDEIQITTNIGNCYSINLENKAIYVMDNGYKKRYALSKLDYIQLGN